MIPEEECPRIEQLSAFADGEMDASVRSGVDAHVARCPICAASLAEIRQLTATFAALPAVSPALDLATLVDQRIGDAATGGSPPRPRLRRWRWWQMTPVVVGGALAMFVGSLVGNTLVLGTLGVSPPPPVRMAAFTALPPGALCPGLSTCRRTES